MFKRGLHFKIFEVYRLQKFNRRFIAVKIEISGTTFLLANIYAPNKDDPEFFLDVFNRLDQTGIDRKIIAGDFNTVLDETLDRRGQGYHRNTKARKVLQGVTDTMDLVDFWREIPRKEWVHMEKKISITNF